MIQKLSPTMSYHLPDISSATNLNSLPRSHYEPLAPKTLTHFFKTRSMKDNQIPRHDSLIHSHSPHPSHLHTSNLQPCMPSPRGQNKSNPTPTPPPPAARIVHTCRHPSGKSHASFASHWIKRIPLRKGRQNRKHRRLPTPTGRCVVGWAGHHTTPGTAGGGMTGGCGHE